MALPSKHRYAPVAGPPTLPPPPGYEYYLPEYFYLFGDRRIARLAGTAARVSAAQIARWSDRYRGRIFGRQPAEVEGSLSGPPDARAEQILEMLGRLEAGTKSGTPYEYGLELSSEGACLLDQYDGFPGILALTPAQFAELQRVWIFHGLPSDLYYPASEQRTVIEPVEAHGGLVRAHRRYTPQYWARRGTTTDTSARFPSEEERQEAFSKACRQFLRAIRLRMAELLEPGREIDHGQVSRLRRLAAEVERTETFLASAPPDREN